MKKIFISLLSVLTGMGLGVGTARKMFLQKEKEIQSMSDKHLALFLMMNQWVSMKQKGKNLVSFFEKNGYKRIAVYGMSYIGETLVNELKDTGVTVVYGIDKNAGILETDLKVVSMEDNLDAVDAVVVTAITFFDEIEEELSAKLNCPIISLEDIIYEM